MVMDLREHTDYIDYYNAANNTTLTVLTNQQLGSILYAGYCVRVQDSNVGIDIALTDLDVPVVYNSKEYLCSAGNMSVPRALTLDKELSQRQIDIKFDDIQGDWRDIVSSYQLKNSSVQIDLVYLSPIDASIIYSVPWFKGAIASTKYSDNALKGTCELTVSCNPMTSKLSEGQKMYASDSIWQNLYPGDLFFSQIGKGTDKTWKEK
jgi:hypothetical protein